MQKEIQLTDKTLLVVGLPNEAKDFEIVTNQSIIPYGKSLNFENGDFRGYRNFEGIEIPQGDWQLLGIYPELTEEQVKMVVDLPQYEHYFNYSYKNAAFKWLRTAKESFQSLMEREKCYIVNPYGEEKPYISDRDICNPQYGERLKLELDWIQAQQRTFSKFAILIKSK